MQGLLQDHTSADRQSDSLAALAVTLFLIVASLFLIQHLRLEAELQDCVLSGRTACTPDTSLTKLMG